MVKLDEVKAEETAADAVRDDSNDTVVWMGYAESSR
jgi:hypothetical protein